jgi:CheY-like chemotaxis protein
MNTAKRVLIVEDDATLANAIALAVKKVGYASSVTSKPEEALEYLDRDRFAIVYIDCLLPQMPGVELAKKIRQQFSSQILPIVMMSGIFTDKITVKEMINETQAKDFLKKPFDVSDVTKYLAKEVNIVKNQSLVNNVMTLFERIYDSPDDIQNELKGVDRVDGFEVPLLVTVLVEMHFSGTVSLTARRVVKAKIVFFKGNIIHVGSEDPQSFIGRLLLSRGYVFIEDLESVLKISSNKRVASRLVEENLLSPHALDEVLQEQMALRMSKIITDENFNVQIEFDEPNYDAVSILVAEFPCILEEWINAKVSTEWLASEFMKMIDFNYKMGTSYRENHPYLKAAILKKLPNLMVNLTKLQSFSGLLELYKDSESDFFRAFYFLVCGGLVVFSEKVAQMSDDERFIRLQKMSGRMGQMDMIEIFEFMGGRPGATEAEVRAVYEDFNKRYLGNHSGVSGISGFSELYYDVKKKADMALQLFLNPRELKNYEQKLQAKKATDQIKAQELVQEAKKLLSLNQYQKAVDQLTSIPQSLGLENRNLYLAWAKLGLLETSKSKIKDMQEVDVILLQTSAEEKVSAIGNFVKGLIAKLRGDFPIAKKHFEAAMALDRNFIEARRELNSLNNQSSNAGSGKPPDLLRGDLKDVVSYLFKGAKKK